MHLKVVSGLNGLASLTAKQIGKSIKIIVVYNRLKEKRKKKKGSLMEIEALNDYGENKEET